MIGRTIAWSSLVTFASVLLGCDSPATETSPAAASPSAAPASAAPASAAPASAAPASPPASAPQPAADPLDPCTWVTTDDLARTLAAKIDAPTKTKDEARQIATCRWTQPGEWGPVGLVDIGVSLTPGAEAYQTNLDLAPAYFDGDAAPITIAGADKAYLVVKKDANASVVGMLIGEKFVLVQVALADVKPEQTQALAAQLASRIR